MWPQQGHAMSIPLQPGGQYPSYAYNNNNNMMPVPPPQLPPPQQHNASPSTESPGGSERIDESFKRQQNGPILWFAGPPLNVIPEKQGPIHSLSYLDWKHQQQSVNK